MEPTQALQLTETVLRLVVRQVLGETAWLNAPGAPKARLLERGYERDVERRDGVVVPQNLIEFTETRELTEVIEANWSRFEPVFQDESRTRVFFGIINDVRNTAAHSRDLVPFERELLSGAAGQLRQQVALWRNRDDPSTRFYPRIEKVRDQFGTEGSDDYSLASYVRPSVRLQVGDVLQFSGSAFGDQRRPVRWWVGPGMYGISFNSEPEYGKPVEGDTVELTYTVTANDIGENLDLAVSVATSSKHRRHKPRGDYDDRRLFRYAVDPPDDE